LPQPDKISEYLDAVCGQIRWRKAHNEVAAELRAHIEDQRAAYLADGYDEEAATEMAITEMGDPLLVGSELDRTHRPKVEWSIIALTSIALSLGLALKIYISSAADTPWLSSSIIISTTLGIGCLATAFMLDFTIIGRYPKVIYWGLAAVTVGVTLLSPPVNGRHLYGQYPLLFFPLAVAGIIYDLRGRGYPGIILSLAACAVPALLGLIVPSLANVVLCSLACLGLLTFAVVNGFFKVNKRNALLLVHIPTVIVTAGSAFMFIAGSPYRLQRFLTAFNPALDPLGAGYIGTIIRDMLAGARVFGPGDLTDIYGNLLPNVLYTDYLLTYLVHRLGWAALVVIMGVLLVFLVRAGSICLRQKSVMGKLTAAAVLATLAMQTVLYAANNFFPLFASLPLPLISYGGTATVIDMLLIGVMLSVFKTGDLANDSPAAIGPESRLIEFVDGKIVIDLHLK